MKTLLDFFSPPVFPDDEEKTRSAYYLNAIAIGSIVILTLFLIYVVLTKYYIFVPKTDLILEGMICILLLVFFMEKNEYIQPASYLYILTIWIASTIFAANGSGVKDVIASSSYLVVVTMSSLILGYRTALWLTGLSILSIFALAYGNSVGFFTEKNEPPFAVAAQITVLLIFGALFIYLSISSLQNAIKQAREKSQELEKSNKELKELDKSLEAKVAERTSDLLKANVENKRRAAQFQTVAQISQKIASERDLDTLLSIITEVISTQFNYHHVAIYLNDDMQEYTILSAASSENGKRMMERGHKLPIELTGIVGYVAKAGNSRLTADTRTDGIDFNGAEFFETRSEFGLPLKVGAQVIGVLDVQSKEANAFNQTDVEALTALANQITIAIQNTRLFAETQTALAESQLLYGTVVKQTWNTNIQSNPQIGYRYSGLKPVPLQQEIYTTEIREALDNDNIAVTHPSRRKNENAIAIPLKLRESTIGVININFPVDTEIGEDEIDVILAASQRIALALENASLLEESQRRARREQTISEMSAKIGASTEVETILKTALRELGAQIGGAQISVEMGSENE